MGGMFSKPKVSKPKVPTVADEQAAAEKSATDEAKRQAAQAGRQSLQTNSIGLPNKTNNGGYNF